MEHDFFESGYGWVCNKHPFQTMKQCLVNDMTEAIKGKEAQFYYAGDEILNVDSIKWGKDQEELQHKLIMDSIHPPVAQLAEAPDSKPVQSEFESQQEDKIVPGCPSCGLHQTLSIRQIIKQEDYQPIHGVSKTKDGLIFSVGEPHSECFLEVLESYLYCSNCLYETAMGEEYSVVPSGHGVL